jgi:uncharacterized protein
MKLTVLEISAAVCQLKSNSEIPQWALKGSFYSISKTMDELSVVCDQAHVPADIKAERNWTVFKVEGPLDFSLTGILSSISAPLAAAKISIFAVSTFDTDYVMVKTQNFENAVVALRNSGFQV